MKNLIGAGLLAMTWGCSSGTATTSTASSTAAGSTGGSAVSSASSAGSTSGSHGATSSSSTSSAGSTGSHSTASSNSSSTGTSGGSTTTGGSTGTQTTLFPSDAPWNQDVSAPQPAAESNAIITDLTNNGGWGNSNRFQIDFSFEVLHANAATPRVSWTQTDDFYSPDCDADDMPLPATGSVEGETGYACTQDGDCHLLVIDDVNQKLFEMWRANQTGSTLNGGCMAKWDLLKHYPANLRGDGCTSADAGGFPITAMLFNADEVAAGHIDHAIRFILPNARIRHGEYVHPATHTTGPTAGGPHAPPYGVRLRLKSTFNVAGLPSEGAKVVARALQKYGMFLSDGGQIALTAQDDRYTTAKWSGLLDSHDLASIATSDFEVVNLPAATPLDDCARNP